MSRRSALGSVLGLGSAKEGTSHWWLQRVTALALLPLGLWFVFSLALLIGQGGSDYLSIIDWIARPFNALALILLVAASCYHSALGVQVVIEDYVHGATKVLALIGQKFAHAVAAAIAIFAVLRIALSA